MKRVANAADPLHARLLIGLLEDQGIHAIVQGEELWTTRGSLPFTEDSSPSVWIADDDDFERARLIIANTDVATNPQLCTACGHDLRGLGETRCPECGTSFRRSGQWHCPNCKEEMGTQFESCWKCNTPRGDAPEVLPGIAGQQSGEADPNCPKCRGTRRARWPLVSFSSNALGLLAVVAAVWELVERFSNLLGSLTFLMIAGGCFVTARVLRFRICPCTQHEESES